MKYHSAEMSTEATLYLITRWLTYVLAIPMIVLGITGAILTTLVFTKQPSFWRNPSINYLLAGAVMTAIHLPIIYLQSILASGFGVDLFNTNDAACREHNYLLYATTAAPISFTCWATFDQYASTSREASFRNRWSSIRAVRLIIVGTLLFWTLVYIPIIFVSTIVSGVCVLKSGPFTTFNAYVLTPFVFSVGPFLVITIFTQGTVRNLRLATTNNSHGHLAKQIRRMLIPQLVVLAISGMPFGFESIYLELTRTVEKDAFRVALEYLLSQIILLFFHCNFACTFYIYWYMSSEVRKALRRLMPKCIRRSNVEAPTDTSDNPIILRTLSTVRSSLPL